LYLSSGSSLKEKDGKIHAHTHIDRKRMILILKVNIQPSSCFSAELWCITS